MAANTERNGVVHGSGRGGIVAVGAVVHACSNIRNGCSIVIVVFIEHHHVLVDAGPVRVVLWWLVLGAQREHRLAEDHLRGGNELAFARSFEHFQAVAGL
eukprot:1855003-Pleurochrysis_carterae.AAC.1